MRILQASTSYGMGIPSFVVPSRLRLRHRHEILAKVEHLEKFVEIMRKFSGQYAGKSGTYFCVEKGVTSVVIKVITRINYGQSISINGLAGMSMVQFLKERNVGVVIRDERDLNVIRIHEASVGGSGGALLSLVAVAVDVSLVVMVGFGVMANFPKSHWHDSNDLDLDLGVVSLRMRNPVEPLMLYRTYSLAIIYSLVRRILMQISKPHVSVLKRTMVLSRKRSYNKMFAYVSNPNSS